jgi:peptide/nickel transport system substrate-binding protein
MSQRRRLALASPLVGSVALAVAAPADAAGPALIPGRPGGVMNVLTREDLAQGFSIHESVTLSTIWPAQPCFNNLVTFDPVKPLETFDTVVPELAERWSWQDRSTSSSTTAASRRGTTRATATRRRRSSSSGNRRSWT